MTPTNTFPTNAAADAAKAVGDKITDAASTVKQQIDEAGRAAADKLEQTRHAAAKGLESTASALHQGGEKLTSLAHSTADKLAGTADYLRNNDVKRMITDVEQVVKRNPGISLMVAGFVGFLLARTMRRSD